MNNNICQCIIKQNKFIKINKLFEKIKLFDSSCASLSLSVNVDDRYINTCDDIMDINSYLENNTIFLFPGLFLYNNILKIELNIEHIIAIIGHEIGHYKLNHFNSEQSLQQEIEADQYSIEILKKLNMNIYSMINVLGIIFRIKEYKNKLCSNIIERIVKLDQFLKDLS